MNSETYIHSYVHSSIIYNCPDWKKPKCPSTDEWIKKIWCIHTMEYCSAVKKNEIMPFAAYGYNEIIILSEVSQKETYQMIPLRCRI